jgi:LPXTG-site transpeptidase (sortase) family protein
MFIHWNGSRKKSVLLVSSVILYSVSSFGLYKFQVEEKEAPFSSNIQTEASENETVYPGIPVSLLIPEIDVRADIQLLGVDANGKMEVPTNAYDVGWFELGSRPGEVGSAVIAGHMDSRSGTMGVFANLHKLKEKNILYVQDNLGTMHIFIVREIRILGSGFANEVFSNNDGSHLNLVTCDGVWDNKNKSYDKRLVVFTDKLNI